MHTVTIIMQNVFRKFMFPGCQYLKKRPMFLAGFYIWPLYQIGVLHSESGIVIINDTNLLCCCVAIYCAVGIQNRLCSLQEGILFYLSVPKLVSSLSASCHIIQLMSQLFLSSLPQASACGVYSAPIQGVGLFNVTAYIPFLYLSPMHFYSGKYVSYTCKAQLSECHCGVGVCVQDGIHMHVSM